MEQIFEALMIIAFGLSWPTNIFKSLKAKTTKGKSLLFLILVFIGYLFGISAKVYTNTINYVFIFYIINTIMVFIDIMLYFRNLKFDKTHTKK
jgi:hypothetical protein